MLFPMRLALLLVLSLGSACSPIVEPVVPVHVVDEHHLAWPVWEEARAQGARPGALLIHFDAHEDLGEPDLTEPLPTDPAEAIRVAAADLSVAEPIVPALLNATIAEVWWVVPPWLEEEPRDEVRFVGSTGGRRQELRVGDLSEREFPDRRPWRYRVMRLAEVPTPPLPVILDIDLDFFACKNPHEGHTDTAIDRAEYDRGLAAGRVRLRGESTEGGRRTESTILARPPGPFTWPVRLDRITDLTTGAETFVRGSICMGEYDGAFPTHRPSPDDLTRAIDAVGKTLRRAGVRPYLITISRSATSGFVPPARAAAIEAAVRKMLVACQARDRQF